MLHADLLTLLETNARKRPDDTFFLDASNSYTPITYKQLRDRALRLVRALHERGIQRGGCCAVDLENGPEFVYMLIAAAYGGFGLVALNTRLTVLEKRERARELYHYLRCDTIARLDQETIHELLQEQTTEGNSDANILKRTAQQGIAGADDMSTAVVMFTSGTQGKPKAANLTWENVIGAAAAANARLCSAGEGRWQLALPMYHVGGLEVVMRSLLNGNDFILYNSFDPYIMLRDARHFDVTHISVVDKMLQDLLDIQKHAETEKAYPDIAPLSTYECILLGGAAPNSETLKRCLRAKAAVEVSYGLTETASIAASARLTKNFDGFISPLPGYTMMVLDPDADGVGRLAVKGPGVFAGYLNAQATFTPDGFFLTGDAARAKGHRIHVAERSDDMFISGGENIYPQEIRDKMCGVPGVADAFVFGVEHPTWGRRPIAFVEPTSDTKMDNLAMARHVQGSLETRLSRVYTPDHVLVLPELPRTSVGKIDQQTCKQLWDERIQIEKVELWRVKIPVKAPIKTPKTTLHERDSLLLRITDACGRTGVGECVAFATDWYLPETLASCEQYLENTLLPALLHQPFLHPRDAAQLIAEAPEADQHPLACAAVEQACWDAYGKAVKRSIRALIGARELVTESGAIKSIPEGWVPGGAVLGLCSPKEAVAHVERLVEAGYHRVKLKVQPGRDIKTVAAVREAFPDITLALDANQSYKDTQEDRLREMDSYGISFIEEPLRADWTPRVGPKDLFTRLARLQDALSAQVCLDESWVTSDQLRTALEEHPELRCVSMKIAKFGGLQAALDFYEWARARGIQMVVGGMYDTGISKRLHAAFCMLPGMQLPGDISSSSRYFNEEVCTPAFELEDGLLEVNPESHPYGLGCELNQEALARVLVRTS